MALSEPLRRKDLSRLERDQNLHHFPYLQRVEDVQNFHENFFRIRYQTWIFRFLLFPLPIVSEIGSHVDVDFEAAVDVGVAFAFVCACAFVAVV